MQDCYLLVFVMTEGITEFTNFLLLLLLFTKCNLKVYNKCDPNSSETDDALLLCFHAKPSCPRLPP